jgi:hypothetical protein
MEPINIRRAGQAKETSALLAEMRLLRERLEQEHQRRGELLARLSDSIKQSFRVQGQSAALLVAAAEKLQTEVRTVESNIAAGELALDRCLTAAA